MLQYEVDEEIPPPITSDTSEDEEQRINQRFFTSCTSWFTWAACLLVALPLVMVADSKMAKMVVGVSQGLMLLTNIVGCCTGSPTESEDDHLTSKRLLSVLNVIFLLLSDIAVIAANALEEDISYLLIIAAVMYSATLIVFVWRACLVVTGARKRVSRNPPTVRWTRNANEEPATNNAGRERSLVNFIDWGRMRIRQMEMDTVGRSGHQPQDISVISSASDGQFPSSYLPDYVDDRPPAYDSIESSYPNELGVSGLPSYEEAVRENDETQ